ncbi:hypothetical protein [Achromobacter sp.]
MIIDHEREGHVDAIMRATNGRGADVVFDTIGGNT